MSDGPAVSVVMSVYNGAARLGQTLDGILGQTLREIEVIVVDDGSTDATSQILADYARRDARVRVISQQNTGLTRALIRACQEARAPFIARHDAGDYSKPERMEREHEALHQHPDVAFVSCWTEFVGPEMEPLFVARGNGRAVQPIDIIDVSKEHGIVDGPTVHGSVMFRRDAYDRAGGYRAAFYYAQDWDLWYRLAKLGKFLMISEPLYVLVVAPATISSEARGSQMRLSRLAHRALLARERGQSDQEIVEKASRIEQITEVSRRGKAAAFYFIGEALRRNGDPRARAYLRRAIASWPLHVKAWLRYLQAKP